MTGRPRRDGSVLAVAILVLMALQLLAHGALVMAQAEWAASLAGLRVLQARAGADAGAALVEGALPGTWDTIPILGTTPIQSGTLAGSPFQGQARRLSREYWLLEGRGRSGASTWVREVGRVIWILDPFGRIAAATGAAEVVGALPDSDEVIADAVPTPSCERWRAVLDSVTDGAAWSSAVRVPGGEVGEPSLGRLAYTDLADGLATLAATTGTPNPVVRFGRCDTATSWNWGDPVHSDGPCGDAWVALVAAGDLSLRGGVGQGVLVVAGDLILVGTRFDGVVLTGGSTTLVDGAEVRGMLRVGGDLVVGPGAQVVGSPCRGLRALMAIRSAVQRPIRVVAAGVVEGAR